MVFEIGKYYRHTGGGGVMHIVSGAKTTQYGWCLIAEEHGYPNLLPIGSDEQSAVNWKEIDEADWMSGFS
jgi:hypothetical protein